LTRTRWITGAIVAALLILVGGRFYAILKDGSKPRSGGRRGAAVTPVYVEKVGKRVIQVNLDVLGNVEASQTVDIVAKSAGPILELPWREGDPVKKGQLLAKIDPGQLQANYYKKKSDLASAQFTYYQLLSQQELTEVQASSGVSIAQADLQAAEANVKRSQANFKATLTLGDTSAAQAQAQLVGAKAQLRQAEVDFVKAKAKYQRMTELHRQGFSSNADLQDSYQDVLSAHAAVDLQRANVDVAKVGVTNAKSQASKDSSAAFADIETSRFTKTSKAASVAEARAGTSKTEAFRQQLLAQSSLVEAAESDLRVAKLQLDDTSLYSPVNGFVSERVLDVGSVTSVGTKILTVQSGGEVWIVTPLPQEVYGRVAKGLACQVSVDGNRGARFPGRVFSKDAAIDTVSRQFNVRIKIEDPKKVVKPGMFARVALKVGSPEPQLAIPTSALYDKDEETRTGYVYQVVDKKVKKVKVRYGLAEADYLRLREGLKEGDTLVIQTGTALKDGQAVKPQTLTPTPTPTPMRGN